MSNAQTTHETTALHLYDTLIVGLAQAADISGEGIAYTQAALPPQIHDAKDLLAERAHGASVEIANVSGSDTGYALYSSGRIRLRLLLGSSAYRDFLEVVDEQRAQLEAAIGKRVLFESATYNVQAPGATGDWHRDDFLTIVMGSGDVEIKHRASSRLGTSVTAATIEKSYAAVVNGEFPRFINGKKVVAPKHQFNNPSPDKIRDSLATSFAVTPVPVSRKRR